jgi:hypothetical protein
MPNWCSNGVTITHEDTAKIAALAEAFKEGKFCNHVIPVPEDLQIVAGRVGADDNAEQIELERRTKENLEKYGAGNWYDFCVSRWGTKWDVTDECGVDITNDGRTMSASFESAWSPPCGVYEELVDQGYEVIAYYYEPGMGYVGKWEDGIDDCHEYGSENSKTVRDAIGEELDDYWGISESMAEWEEENMDEVQEWYEDGVEKKGLEPHSKD